MLESLKTTFYGMLCSVSLPVARWSAKKLFKYPPPTDKEEFRKWALWLCQNRVLLLVQYTPTEIDDKALDIVESVLESDILFGIVWDKIHGVEPEPDKQESLSFFDRVKLRIKNLLHRNDANIPEELEVEAQAEAEAGSVLTAVWIFSLLLQTPNAIKSLQELVDFVKKRLGDANGQF